MTSKGRHAWQARRSARAYASRRQGRICQARTCCVVWLTASYVSVPERDTTPVQRRDARWEVRYEPHLVPLVMKRGRQTLERPTEDGAHSGGTLTNLARGVDVAGHDANLALARLDDAGAVGACEVVVWRLVDAQAPGDAEARRGKAGWCRAHQSVVICSGSAAPFSP